MKKSLPYLSALGASLVAWVAIAQPVSQGGNPDLSPVASGGPKETASAAGDQLLVQAIMQLERRGTISARFLASIFDNYGPTPAWRRWNAAILKPAMPAGPRFSQNSWRIAADCPACS